MRDNKIHRILKYCIAAIWFINGFFCKVLNLVPRHQEIVANILGSNHARLFTLLIGISEIVMAAWIVTGIKPRLNALVQMVVIAAMNILEFLLVPELLLWGRMNALFALVMILVIYFNEFHLHKKIPQQV